MQPAAHLGVPGALFALCSLVPPAAAQVCPPGQNVDTLTHSTASPATNVPWRDLVASLPKFDPSLGTLLQATVTARAIVIAGVQAENTAAQGCTLAYEAGADFEVSFPGNAVPPLALSPTISGTVPLGAFDGSVDFAGASGFATSGQTSELVSTTILDAGVLQSVFVGAGTVDFVHDAALLGSSSGCASPTFATSANGRLELTVSYTYCTGACVERNRRRCASLLLYPEFDNRPGILTLFTVTDGCCDVQSGNVQVEYRFINKDNCLKTDQTFTLTPCDTLSFITSAPGINSGGPNRRGYAYVYAKNAQASPNNPTGTPIVWNHLIGQELVLNGIDAVDYSVNAVGFRGIGREGEPNDDDGDGVRDLEGPGPFLAEYEEAPEEILIPRFLGQDEPLPGVGPGPGGLFDSELILINLSGGSSFTTIVDVLGFNDNEEPFSSQYEFYCWDKPKLREVAPFALQDYLANQTNDDPDEIVGAPQRESGWLILDGLVANSAGPEAIVDPAIYAVLVECAGGQCAADLPFERCSQENGDLLPNGPFGDGPDAVPGDNR